MKKLLLILLPIFLSVAGYSQSATKGALNTYDISVWNPGPAMKMLAVAAQDNLVYYWNAASWAAVGSGSGSGWGLTGNSGTTAGTNFLGTTDATALVFKTNSFEWLRLTSAGNFGVGVSPSYKLDVLENAAGVFAANVYNANADGAGMGVAVNNSVVDRKVFDVLSGSGGATSRFFVTADGKIVMPSLTNLTTQDRLVGVLNSSGRLGNITLSGLTISSGVLSADFTASSTNTLTNKRWTARVGSTTSSATPTINTDSYDIYKLTAQAAAITSMSSSLSGTPVDGDILEIQFTDNGTARAITWGASFASSSVSLPTTTVISTTLTVILQYYTTSSYGNTKWICVNTY